MWRRDPSPFFFLKEQLLIPVCLNSPFIPIGVGYHLYCIFSVHIYLGLLYGSHLCAMSLSDSIYPNSLIAQLVKNPPAMQETLVRFLGQEDPLEKGQAPHSSVLGFPGDSAGKESTCNVGDLGLIPGLGGSPGEGNGYPLQYSDLENSMGCVVHGVAKSQTRLSDFHFSP